MSYFDDNEDRIVYGRQFTRRRPSKHDYAIAEHRGVSAEPGSELARARQAAHRAFDPQWQSGKMTRHQAYVELARRLGIPVHKAHMQLFDLATCQRVVALFTADDFEDMK